MTIPTAGASSAAVAPGAENFLRVYGLNAAAHPFSFRADAPTLFASANRKEPTMKTLMLTASALTLIAAPAHAQLLGGGGQAGVTGSLNGTINSTVRAPTDTVRSTTRGTLRADAATRGSQNVDRENGSVSIDRSADTSLDATTRQLLGTPAGEASGNASGAGNASGSGSANAQLIGTDAVTSTVRGTASTVGNVATSATSSAGQRASGATGQAGSPSCKGR